MAPERLFIDGPVALALAVSADETLIAAGGSVGSPVTALDRSSGVRLELGALPDEVAGLAFAADATSLAAVSVRGAHAHWSLPQGRLLASRPATARRRFRSIAFVERPTAPELVATSDSIHGTRRRALAPGGQYFADAGRIVQVRRRSGGELARLDLAPLGLEVASVPSVGWSGDGRTLAIAGEAWCALWRPFEPPSSALVVGPAPTDRQAGGAIAALGDGVLCATERWVELVELPDRFDAGAATTSTPATSSTPAAISGVAAGGRTDWNWDIDADGYEGVTVQGSSVLWYSHSHNPHAGGGASEQSFTALLTDGPPVPVPADILAEVIEVARRSIRR